jgi:two-component sensor histidine kinase
VPSITECRILFVRIFNAKAEMPSNDKDPVVERALHEEEKPEIALRALEVRIRQQECLAELGVIALRGATLDTLLTEAVRLTAEGLRTDFCKVLEHLPSEHRFLVRAGVGWGEGVVGVATVGDDLESPAGYALRTKRPVISNHLEQEERFRTPAIFRRFGIRRAMNVILQGDGRPYGVLEVDSQSGDEFEQPDLAFLQGVANLAGMAIERERHERNLTAALERHKYLLKELNHRVKNSLAIVNSVLGLQASRSTDPVLASHLREAMHRITAIAKAHELLYLGSDIESLDIGKYIETVCKDLNTGIPGHEIRVSADYGIEIPTDQAISTALIVNELITNAVKYAYPNKAGEIWVTLSSYGDSGFSISVHDGGVGLPSDFSAGKKQGLGMRLVTALVQQLNGTLEVQAGNPGAGFRILVPKANRPLPAEEPVTTCSSADTSTPL